MKQCCCVVVLKIIVLPCILTIYTEISIDFKITSYDKDSFPLIYIILE